MAQKTQALTPWAQHPWVQDTRLQLPFPDQPQIQPTWCQCREQPAIYHLSQQHSESKMGSGARSTGLGRALSAWLK